MSAAASAMPEGNQIIDIRPGISVTIILKSPVAVYAVATIIVRAIDEIFTIDFLYIFRFLFRMTR